MGDEHNPSERVMFISGSPISDYDDMSAPVDWIHRHQSKETRPVVPKFQNTHLSLSLSLFLSLHVGTNHQVSNCRGAQKSCLQSRNFMEPRNIPRPWAHALISTRPLGFPSWSEAMRNHLFMLLLP